MKDDIFSEFFGVHDRYRFEIKTKINQEFDGIHSIEYYFYIPSSLNISHFTYNKEQFYSSIQRYIRYSAPPLQIKDLFNINNVNSPFFKTLTYLDKLKSDKSRFIIESLIDEMKLMSVIIKDRINELSENKNLEYTFNEIVYIKSIVFESFEHIKRKITSFPYPSDVYKCFAYIDDYTSLLIMEFLLKLYYDNIKTISKEMVLSIQKLTNEIYIHRKNSNYPYCDNNDELFLYHRGLLKKFISSCLFLNTQPSFNIYSHIASSIASAIAMLFAILITIYAQTRYSFTSVFFILIAVVSYVFKDRIKELVKVIFYKKAGRFIYDRKIKITEPSHKFSIGYIKESFLILTPSMVGNDIKKIRELNEDENTEEMNNQTVIKYRKVIKIDKRKILKYHTRRRDLVDIMRFSIYDFLKHADDENVTYWAYIDNNFAEKVISKNYVIILVVKYVYGLNSIFEKYRIIFNRSGIIRVDKVV